MCAHRHTHILPSHPTHTRTHNPSVQQSPAPASITHTHKTQVSDTHTAQVSDMHACAHTYRHMHTPQRNCPSADASAGLSEQLCGPRGESWSLQAGEVDSQGPRPSWCSELYKRLIRTTPPGTWSLRRLRRHASSSASRMLETANHLSVRFGVDAGLVPRSLLRCGQLWGGAPGAVYNREALPRG